jgi:hypothetical protein
LNLDLPHSSRVFPPTKLWSNPCHRFAGWNCYVPFIRLDVIWSNGCQFLDSLLSFPRSRWFSGEAAGQFWKVHRVRNRAPPFLIEKWRGRGPCGIRVHLKSFLRCHFMACKQTAATSQSEHFTDSIAGRHLFSCFIIQIVQFFLPGK